MPLSASNKYVSGRTTCSSAVRAGALQPGRNIKLTNAAQRQVTLCFIIFFIVITFLVFNKPCGKALED